MNLEDLSPDEDWIVHLDIGITDVRELYRVVSFALENGYKEEEREYLEALKGQLYAMLLEYSFTHIE